MNGVITGDRPSSARFTAWLWPLAVLAAYAVFGALLHGHHFGEGLKAEDSHWIRGDFFGTPLRLTQHWLLHRVCFPLFGDNLDAYYGLTLGLHVLNAWLVAALYASLARGMGGPWPRPGALLAGALLLCYNRDNLNYVSAVSYQLVVLFLLCGTLGVVGYLRRRRPLAWAVAVVAYGLALLTNIFALGFPLLWVALEAAWPGGAVGEGRAIRPWRPAAVRYGLLVIPLGLLLWQHGAFLWGYQGLKAALAEPLWQAVMQLPVYVTLALTGFLAALTGTTAPAPEPWLAGALFCLLVGWGAWALHGKRPAAAPAVVLRFVVGWSTLSFLQALAARDGLSGGWRYYYNAAGVALAVAWVIMALVDRAASRVVAQRRGALVATVTAVALAALVAVNPGLRRWWQQDEGDPAPHGRRGFACDSARVATGTALGPGADLRCRDLRGMDLRQEDLTGADLRGAQLARSNLMGGRLRRARLQSAHLLWADLDGADLTGALLDDANLFGAAMVRVQARGARLASARLAGARLREALLARATLTDADLSGARAPRANLSGADLSRALLSKTDLRRANLFRARLSGATLNEADLRGARLEGAILDGADLRGALICARHRATLRGYRGIPTWVPCRR